MMIEDPSMISNVVWGCIVLATILWIRQRYTTTSKIFEAWQIWVEEWYDVLSYSVLTCVLFAAWVDGNFDWNHSVFSVIYVLLGGLLFCVCWCNHTLFPVACTASLVVVLTSIQVTITLSGELHLFAILCVGGLTLQSVCWWLSFLPAQTVLAAVTLGRYTAAGLLLGLGIDACRLHSSSGGGSVLFRHIESAVAMEDETRGGSLSPPSLSLSWSLWLLITALGVWKTCLMPLLSVAWNAVSGTPRGYSHDYVSIPDGDAGLELGPKVQTSMPKPECRTAASGARNNRVCNFFDPSLSYSPAGSDTNPGPGAQTLEQLPSLVAMTTHMVGALGFQADNARNQAEHAAMLLHNELLCLGELESLGTGSGRGGGFTRQHWTQAAESLHGKLFGNYSRWCERMSTEAEPVHPLFLRQYVELDTTAKFASYPDCTNCHGNYDEACTGGVAADANVGIGGGDAGSCSVPGLCDRALHTLLMEDILVFLLVWGEAANLRHCPECLCYLYHQCMWVHIFTQYRHQYLAAVAATEGLPTGAGTLIRKVKFRTAVQSGHDSVYTSEDDCLPLPPDYFLTQVVAPLYHAVAASAGAKGDHRDRRHYDDLNEFFWSRDCLKLGVFTTTPGEQGQDGNYAISPLELLLSSEIESEGDDGGVLQWVSAQCQLPIPVTASRLHVAAVLSAPSSNRNAGGDPSGWPVYRKTFVEKRSWLHALYSFHRLIELHLVMFASTAVLAFAHALKWGGAYTLHVLSFLGLAVNCLHIVWTVLQVWAKHPGAAPSAASGGGTAWRLAVGFALAVAQLVYYQRSFEYTFNGHGSRALLRETVTQLLHDTSTTDGSGWSIVSSVQGGVSAEVAGASFWYWQYVYVTALALGGYMAEGVLTLAPRFVTAAMASRSALVQAALRVYYPIAELYLAKSIHIGDNESSCGTGRGCLAAVSHFVTLETLQYVGFWVVPLVVKATFGYFVVVQPLVPATLLLYDDYMNGLQLSEGYTEGGSGNLLLSPSTQSLLLAIIAVFVRWFPAMLVYFLDMAIWFAVWSSMVGGGVALVERQGAVRDTPTLRNHFIRAPLCFCQKLLPASSSLSVDRGEHVSTMDLAGLIDQAGGERATTGGVVHERSALLGGQPSMSIGGGSSSSSHGSSHASSAKRSSYEPVSGDVSRSDQQYQVIAALKTSTSSSALNKLAGLRKNASSGALNKLGLSRGADSPDNSAQLEQGQVNQGQNTGALLASYLGDVRSQRWAAFSVVWDELILKLRATDHISNAQRDRYLFSRCHWLTIALAPASADTSATSRAGTSTGGHVYLPLFQTVEGIERAARLFKISSKALEVATKTSGSGSGNSSGSGNWVSGSAAERQELSLQEAEVERAQVLDDFSYRYHTRVTESEAVKELWALSCWLLTTILGSRHREQLLTCFTCAGEIREPQQWLRVVSGRQLQPLLNSLTAVVASIKQGLSKRKLVAPVPVSTSVSDSSASSGGLVTPVAVRVPLPGMVGGSGGGSGGGMRKSKSRGSLQTLMENPRSPTHAQAQAPLMDAFRDKTREELRALLQNLTRCICTDVTGDGGGVSLAPVAEQLGGILSAKDGFFWDNLYSSSMLDHCCVAGADRECAARMKHVLYKAHGLLVLRANQVELPAESEARRRTTFFVNSLFMDMPAAPAVPHSREYTCVTPYYSEDVLLSRSDLERRNSEGTSTLLYLQTLHKREWTNFLERMGAELQERPHLIFSSKHRPEPASSAGDSDNGTLTASSTAVGDGRQEWWEQQQTYETHTRIWASLRAQTLYRTVEGMMQSQDALRALRRLELASASASGGAYADVEKLVRLKFNYVIACQVYGDMRTNNDAKAQDIELLLERHPNLRLAYIDKVRSPTGLAFYSVLVKFDDSSTSSGISGSNRGTESSSNSTRHLQRSPSFKSKHCIREVFRVRLPGNPILGEGKPENQNHALIFTRGRHLQAVDMNQDGYFEEFLKMRNLLQHFERPEVAIVGFREHIFTGSVSSVANYMALQELSFVTLGQRVLYNPLRVRQHYGHPDLFNKLFVMTEGGMSKASRGINLSEDIFAGFNATLRGRAVLYKEYMQVGKGRDVGLQQTYKFEAKLAQGNAEQSLSRDMHRLCNRLDFFRLLSFYYGGIAHYMTNTLICYSLAVVVYTNTLLVLFSLESVNGRAMQLTSVLTMMLAGMGLLQTAPLAVTLFVERGLTHAATQLCYMVLSGGPLYFIFHIMTRAHYFQRTLAAGNASYKATGRGFVIVHGSFDQNFRFFASSHLYWGFELAVLLSLYFVYSRTLDVDLVLGKGWYAEHSPGHSADMSFHLYVLVVKLAVYLGETWSLWMVAVSFLLSPFWFNPLSFEPSMLWADFAQWREWMRGSGGTGEQSWLLWWREENALWRSLSPGWKLIMWCQRSLVWGMIGMGLVWRDFRGQSWADVLTSPAIICLVQVLGLLLALAHGNSLLSRVEHHLTYASRRVLSMLIASLAVLLLAERVMRHPLVLKYLLASYFLGSAIAFTLLLVFDGSGSRSRSAFTVTNRVLIPLYYMHDCILGLALFVMLFIMAYLLKIGSLHTWLLYHDALSSGVVMEDILNVARRTQTEAAANSLAGTQAVTQPVGTDTSMGSNSSLAVGITQGGTGGTDALPTQGMPGSPEGRIGGSNVSSSADTVDRTTVETLRDRIQQQQRQIDELVRQQSEKLSTVQQSPSPQQQQQLSLSLSSSTNGNCNSSQSEFSFRQPSVLPPK